MRVKIQYRTTSKKVFAKFKLKHPEIKITYPEWCNILYSFNCGFRDYCLETGRKAKFPYGVGEFCVTKYKPVKLKEVDGKQVVNLNVDWKKTNEKGYRVFHLNSHTEGYDFRWLWVYGTSRLYQAEIWSFKPSRVSSRLINHYISQGYKDKYLEWKIN